MVKKKENLFVEYRCSKCGHVFQMNHGPLVEIPDHWKETTCVNMDCEREVTEKRIPDGTLIKIPIKTCVMIRSWYKKG